MNIKSVNIKGFKSIKDITIDKPNPFTVFVGPNAAGKSNIFEALELFELCNIMEQFEAVRLFGNIDDVMTQTNSSKTKAINVMIDIESLQPHVSFVINESENRFSGGSIGSWGPFQKELFGANEEWARTFSLYTKDPNFKHLSNFTKIFINNRKEKNNKINRQDDSQLVIDTSNIEKVLKRIFKDENDRDEIIEIIQLLVPGLKNIEIVSSELTGSDTLLFYEEYLEKPLQKHLISDGTYNILAILTAIYQSKEPQFLCIEEPENGLNPKVVRELVNICRDKCKEKGHYIWLNTHSQTLISELTTDEIILVDKVNGETQIKQIKGMDLYNMRMDEALLTNTIGGGIPW